MAALEMLQKNVHLQGDGRPVPCLDRMFAGPEQTARGTLWRRCSVLLGGGVTCRPWLCLDAFHNDWKMDRQARL